MWKYSRTAFQKYDIVLNGNRFMTGNGYFGYRGTLEEFAKAVQSAGILTVNGAIGNGGVTLDIGATLSGNGTLGGITVVKGALNPGNSPGTLNFTAALALGGTLALNNTGYTATLHDSVQIFQNSTSTSGTFSSITGTDLGGAPENLSTMPFNTILGLSGGVLGGAPPDTFSQQTDEPGILRKS